MTTMLALLLQERIMVGCNPAAMKANVRRLVAARDRVYLRTGHYMTITLQCTFMCALCAVSAAPPPRARTTEEASQQASSAHQPPTAGRFATGEKATAAAAVWGALLPCCGRCSREAQDAADADRKMSPSIASVAWRPDRHPAAACWLLQGGQRPGVPRSHPLGRPGGRRPRKGPSGAPPAASSHQWSRCKPA